MDLQTRKLSFIQEFIRIQNEDIIIVLEKMLKRQKAESYEKNLKRMAIEEFTADIDQSMKDSVHNQVIEAKDLKNEIKKWS